jgi:hypothetical protein
VLEHQQAQHYLGLGARPAAFAALRMPLRQGLVDRRHDLRVGEQLVGLFIHASCQSLTSSAISPSPKLRCAPCVLITL